MHTTPEVLTLLALGEPVATAEEHAHLTHCRVCSAELEELSRVVDTARHSDPDDVLATPRPAVWENIQREIQAGPPPVGASASPGTTAAPVKRRRPLYVLVAAVALVAGLGGGFGIAQSFRPGVGQAAGPVHLNALPGWPGAEGEATIKDDAQGDRVLSVQVSVPEATGGRLEVWLSDERAERMVSMGFLKGDTGSFTIPAGMDLRQSPVLDVSVEPPNDPAPGEHSGVSLVRGRLVR